jgi:hypothetical protein
MPVWEYGYIWVQSGRRGVMTLGDGERESLGLVGGGQDALATLNRVGADGWELIDTEVHPEGAGLGHTVFWLKREKPAATS